MSVRRSLSLMSLLRIPVLATRTYIIQSWEAYDFNQHMVAPPLPNPKPPMDFPVPLDYSGNPQNAGVVVPGSFLGISIEMSLAEALIGPNASWVWPQFLNLMSNLKERGGPPVLRLGGNSQEKAYMVPELPKGHAIERHVIGPSSFTNTPTLVFTKGVMEAMRVVSDIIGIHWIMGIPMNQSQPARLEIVEAAEPILGDYIRVRRCLLALPARQADLHLDRHGIWAMSRILYVYSCLKQRTQVLTSCTVR
jgi:hypothetical protein